MTSYTTSRVLEPATATAVRELIQRAAAADGTEPISEHQRLRLGAANDDESWQHVIAQSPGGVVVGYAIVDTGGDVPEAEFVVDVEHRRGGIGLGLLHAVREISGSRDTLVWAHGTDDGSQLFAANQHAEATRILWQLRRPSTELEDVPLPKGVRLRTFSSGDEQAWLAVNSAAFAEHPEQGSWSIEDFAARQSEPWFDPEGLLIAEAADLPDITAGTVLGFHWTKIHGPSTRELASDPSLGKSALGEVYVVGVDPRAQGMGLGRALTVAGLEHLHSRGVPEVLLYVDQSNTEALGLYRDLGFSEYGRDTQYRLTGS